jgi:hypothetical protein
MSRRITAAVLALLLVQLGGCAGGTVGVSTDYGYWDGPVYGYDVDYLYGPPVVYGGWGPDYYVGPPRHWDGRPPGWDRPPGFRPTPVRTPAFHPAPATRPMPSIPSGPRGRGMRGGTPR